jgi:MerR family transcriptional regulator/heat shock protein HspR
MTTSLSQAVSAVTLDVAARLVHMPPARVRRCASMGLVRPRRVENGRWWFGQEELARLRKIRRLQDDLGLNLAGVEVALRLTERIEQLSGRSTHDVIANEEHQQPNGTNGSADTLSIGGTAHGHVTF